MNRDGAEAKSSPESALLGWIKTPAMMAVSSTALPRSQIRPKIEILQLLVLSLSLLPPQARTARKTARRQVRSMSEWESYTQEEQRRRKQNYP
jgi:hypothetical protein